MDTTLFWSLYGLSQYSAFFDVIGIFFAEYAPYICAAVLVTVAIWPSENRSENRVIVILSVAAGLIARFVVKSAIVFVYPRPRPFAVLPSIHPLIATLSWENLQSFPSGHAILFFAIATVLFCFNKKIGIWSFVIAAVISIARVYVGVHWPSDVFIGAILGIVTGLLTYGIYRIFPEYIDRRVADVFEFFRI